MRLRRQPSRRLARPVYRTLYDAYANDVAPDRDVLRAADDAVVEILTELMRRAPDDLEMVRTIVEEALSGPAWLLLLDGANRARS